VHGPSGHDPIEHDEDLAACFVGTSLIAVALTSVAASNAITPMIRFMANLPSVRE
jgi:hypothetical protein